MFEKTRMSFQSDVFASVAVFDAKATYCPFFTIFLLKRFKPSPERKVRKNLTIDNLFRVPAIAAIFLLKVVVE